MALSVEEGDSGRVSGYLTVGKKDPHHGKMKGNKQRKRKDKTPRQFVLAAGLVATQTSLRWPSLPILPPNLASILQRLATASLSNQVVVVVL